MKPHAPIIIVKKHRGGHGGHHGGAWKVAYADFVTAMMAFFLVMWLIGASPDVKKSIAGYFRDPGVFDFEHSTQMMPSGMHGVDAGRAAEELAMPDPAALRVEQKVLRAAAENIREGLARVGGLAELRDQIEMTVTAEGLRIELVEREGSSFFASGSAALRGESVRILDVIGRELGTMQNDVVVEGHTDSLPYSGQQYSNWELSADRANAARRVMEASGLAAGQVQSVRGYAATQLRLEDPRDPRNRRVSIVVRSESQKGLEQALRSGVERTEAEAAAGLPPSAEAASAPPAGVAAAPPPPQH
ncbi:MAG: flagellar motor protein MotB [Vicinamibacterales bacterium]